MNRYLKGTLITLGLAIGAYGANYAAHKTAAENCEEEIGLNREILQSLHGANSDTHRQIIENGKITGFISEKLNLIASTKNYIAELETAKKEHERKAANLNPFDY